MGNRYQPSLLEINTRAWLNQNGNPIQLKDVSESYWEFLASQGIDYIWLMGIWQISELVKTTFDRDPIRIKTYSRITGHEVDPMDVIGSPYAIDQYIIHPDIGTTEDLIQLRDVLNGLGIKLILDFVPNHFSKCTTHLDSYPQHFIQVDPHQPDQVDYFNHKGICYAHGRDPKSGSWHDTVQVNYHSEDTQLWMINQLLDIAELCDGLRCDMAMLQLNKVFDDSWNESAIDAERPEFWSLAIDRIRDDYPDFIFMAEVYWDLEWSLQQLGFDYTYDKRLLDRLKDRDHIGIHMHLVAGIGFQSKLVRFVENHDEERVLNAFGLEQSKAVAVLTYTLPGMNFYHQGQWEGRMRQIPVQSGKFPREVSNFQQNPGPVPPHVTIFSDDLWNFYLKLTRILTLPVFRFGNWEKLDTSPDTSDAVFAWIWSLKLSRILVLINLSDRLQEFELHLQSEILEIEDLWSDQPFEMGKKPSTTYAFGLRPYQFRFLKLNKSIS